MISRKETLAALEKALGHSFANPSLLDLALTHRSTNVSGRDGDNQRLEFLGDRVLGLAVAEMLYRRSPDEREGEMARRHAALVSRPPLVEVARRLGLAEHLRVAGAGRELDSALEDACEALIGAICLDGGYDAAARFVMREWEAMLGREVKAAKDAKSTLQEWAQGRGGAIPVYEIASQEGPDHAPRFTIRVAIGKMVAEGEGPTRRSAEQAAAAAMLTQLGESA